MSRKKTEGLTEREAEILSILWRLGEVTVEDIRSHMQNKPTANTVRTLLTIMQDRGLVVDDGKGYGRKYRAKVARETAQSSALRKLIDTFFSGSAQEMVLRLTDSGEMDAEQLKALYEKVQQRRKKG